MNRSAALAASLVCLALLSSAPAYAAPTGDWSKLDQALGRQGKDFPGEVHTEVGPVMRRLLAGGMEN